LNLKLEFKQQLMEHSTKTQNTYTNYLPSVENKVATTAF